MIFKLELSTDNVTFSELDLFPNQDLTYDAEFYDDKDVSSIKIPFLTDIKIPLTPANKTFFGYDPVSNNASAYPDGDYFYKISIDNADSTELYGVLKVLSIEYNSDEPYMEVSLTDFLSRFLKQLKDDNVGDLLNSTYHTTAHTYEEFRNTTANAGEAGTVGQNPDYTRLINFPFVDLTNDTQRYSYEARQFLEYGSGISRAGIIPTISVAQYLRKIGTHLSTTQIPVTVKSKLFGVNETAAIADFQPEKLQAIVPAKLQAKRGINTREFQLNQGPRWAYPNESLDSETDLDGNPKDFTSLYYGDYETFGNYNATDDTSYQKYGIKVQDSTTYVNPGDANELGHFCPHMSFKGRLQWLDGAASQATGNIDYELPVLEEDKFVYTIDTANSTMTFNLCIGLYEDGYIAKKVYLNDSNGDRIVLETDAATAVNQGFADKDGEQNNYFRRQSSGWSGALFFDPNTHPNLADVLRWSSVDAYLPADSELEHTFNSDSRYSINYFVEPVGGTIRARVANGYIQATSPYGAPIWHVQSLAPNEDFEVKDIRKAVTELQNFSSFSLLAKASEDFNPYFPSDIYVVKDSIKNTCELGPVDLLSAICKRFGCGLFYEYASGVHTLRIDPLHLLRTSTSDADYMIDDLKSVKVSRADDKVKNLLVKNKNYGLFFDEVSEDVTRGDINQEINEDGLNDLEISLKSAVYYKSLCGEVFSDIENENVINGIINQYEYGITDNVMTPYDKIGVRFAFLDKPLYKTLWKVPYSVEATKKPGLYTTTQRIYRNQYVYPSFVEQPAHTFNGRLSHKNTAGWNLLGEDEGSTTEYYDLISATEQIKSRSALSIEFSMVVPTNQVGDVMFLLKNYTLSLANDQSVLIKSASGAVYENNTYLDIKGIIQ